MTRVSRAEAAETLREQCLRPVDERKGSYPPDHLQALEQDRRANAGREGTTRDTELTVVPGAADADDPGRDNGSALIDELVREGARRMLAEALQAEVEDYIAPHLHERDEHGRRRVVRNGSHQPREVLTSADAVEVVAPPRPPRRPVNSRCCRFKESRRSSDRLCISVVG
jgi:hypothetical protein